MKKILFSAVFALLAVPAFASAADANVANLEEFKAALSDGSTTTISITADFTTAEKILINRPVTIDGGNHVVTFTGDTAGWQGNYVFHVYQTTDVIISNIKLTGGDAALLNNKSAATLTGAIDVSGNEFGGIESSGTGAVLTVSGATLTNSSEAYGLPTLWEDAISGTTVVGGSFTTSSTVKAGQIQYYVVAENATTRHISTTEQLRAAIKSQVDGQTWVIAAGDYGLDRFNDVTVQGQAGWYFPITASNLTVIGTGNPVIYGNEFSLNGNWSTQNLVSVFGNNVTLKGVTLMPKAEGNKTIEVLGNDVIIEDVAIQPNTKIASSVYDGITNAADKAFSKEWGGSIYFNHAGNHIVKNVTIHNGGISFRYSPADTHITFDNVNIVNATADADVNGYRFSSGFNEVSNSTVGLPKVTYKVDALTNNLTSALAGSKDGDTIEITSDITALSPVIITKAITIDAGNHTVSAGFSGGSVIEIQANNVTLKNLKEDAQGTTGNRGINVYTSTGVLLDNVEVANNSKNGIVVNGSTVTINNISTKNNGWEAIDVDLGGGVTSPASLTVNGISMHSEAKAAIRIDDTGKPATVIDTNNQYSITTTGPTNDYFLKTVNVKMSSTTHLTATGITVDIPADAIVTGNLSWNGTIAAPTATTTTVTVSGFNTQVTSAIAIGSDISDLTFTKAVRLLFAGQAGKRVGWYNHAGTFAEITEACASDNQTTGDALPTAGNCKADVGSDLVVWTKHFSIFATYTQTAIPPVSSGGSYFVVSGTPASPTAVLATGLVTGNVPNTTGEVLGAVISEQAKNKPKGEVKGATAYAFGRNMRFGARGVDVEELQKMLIAAGHLKLAVTTQYFGPMTKAAVIKWQAENKLPATGYFGPMSRAVVAQ